MMTQTETDFLRQHDWHTIRCQCPVHPCDKRALFSVAIHQIDRCNDRGLLHGDRIELRCDDCLLRLYRHVGESLRRVSRYGVARCGTCGSPIVIVADVVRRVVAL